MAEGDSLGRMGGATRGSIHKGKSTGWDSSGGATVGVTADSGGTASSKGKELWWMGQRQRGEGCGGMDVDCVGSADCM